MLHSFKRLTAPVIALGVMLLIAVGLILPVSAADGDVIFQYTDAKHSAIKVSGGIFDSSKALINTHKKIATENGVTQYRSHETNTISNYPGQCITNIFVEKDKATLRLSECNNPENQEAIEAALGRGASFSDAKIKNITVNKSTEERIRDELNHDYQTYLNSLTTLRDQECGSNELTDQCRQAFNAKFLSCFNGHTNDNAFTFPNYDENTLATCLAAGDKTKLVKYREALISVSEEAKSDSQDPLIPSEVNSDDREGNEDEGSSSCQVEGIGWILCPVINAMAGMADATFGLVSAFMTVEPLGFNPNNPLYSAWSIMRNVANVAFVIAFLIIIFSQLTGAGISNYGVKKMLPRLVIAAILVNISYFICALAVDVSNILGVAIQDVLTNMADSVGGEENTITEEWGSIATSVLSIGTVGTLGVIGVTVFSSMSIWAMLAGLLPLLVSALFALIIAFLVLLARQAFIIILIVVSPLAFVAFLLPNTENLFNKWRSFFVMLLALFPMMALVFGGSVLASSIMRQGAETSMASSNAGTATMGFFVYLGSVAILAIPFFITPVLIKLSGGVLNRFAGFINNPNKGPIDKLRKGAERIRGDARNRGYASKLNNESRLGKITGYGARRRARVGKTSSSLEGYAKNAESEYIGKTLQSQLESADAAIAGGATEAEANKQLKLASRMSAGDASAARVTSQKVVASLEADDLKEAMQPLLRQLASMDPSSKTAHLQGEIAAGGARRSAALQYSASIGDTGFLRDQLNSGDTDTVRRAREAVNANAGSLAGKAPDLVKGAEAAFSSVKGGDLVQFKKDTAESMIKHIDSLRSAAQAPGASPQDVQKYKTAVDGLNSAVIDISKSPDLQAQFSAEVGTKILHEATSRGLQNDLSALAGIQNDGKIR